MESKFTAIFTPGGNASVSMKRVVLVTGANRGLGFAISRALAELGHGVLLGSRDPAAGDEATASLRGDGLDVTPVHLDLEDAGTIDRVFVDLRRSGRAVDVLVNNAGVLHEKPLLELTEEEISESIAVHVTGPMRLIRLAVPDMLKRKYGRIVNLSSGWGSFAEGMGGPGFYGVTKAALNALTVRFAEELPSDAIKVNAMCPGWVRTRMGGPGAPRTPKAAAGTAVWLATLPEDGPSGGFFRDRKPIPW